LQLAAKSAGSRKMRQAKHLHPEWGFLAPHPSFSRTIRICVIATIVGATAGSGVILSLADRMPDQMSVAARTLAAPTQAQAAPIQPASLTLASVQAKPQSTTEAEPTKATLLPVTPTKPVAYSAPAQKKANKKHHAGPRYASRGRQFTSLMDDWYHAVGL
jgi:hypothetical protein